MISRRGGWWWCVCVCGYPVTCGVVQSGYGKDSLTHMIPGNGRHDDYYGGSNYGERRPRLPRIRIYGRHETHSHTGAVIVRDGTLRDGKGFPFFLRGGGARI